MVFKAITNKGRLFIWYINEVKPKIEFNYENVDVFYADGHELEAIQKRFNNLMIAYAHCLWCGNTAQFIYDNI